MVDEIDTEVDVREVSDFLQRWAHNERRHEVSNGEGGFLVLDEVPDRLLADFLAGIGVEHLKTSSICDEDMVVCLIEGRIGNVKFVIVRTKRIAGNDLILGGSGAAEAGDREKQGVCPG